MTVICHSDGMGIEQGKGIKMVDTNIYVSNALFKLNKMSALA